jgi:hypothetical protein
MVKAMVSALLAVMVAKSTLAPQTAQELAAKYPVVSYNEVRPGVLVEPRYSAVIIFTSCEEPHSYRDFTERVT